MTNVRLSSSGEEVVLELNNDFYPSEKVLESANDFLENFWVRIAAKDDTRTNIYIRSKQDIDPSELEDIGLEFYNYLLGVMQTPILR